MVASCRVRLGLSIFALAATEAAEQPSRRGYHVWENNLAHCSIVWFIHIPKTAGTTITEMLRYANSDEVLFYDLTNASKPLKLHYVQHGANHDWRHPDLLALARRNRRKIIVTAETPLPDLTRRGYPWLEETCFFSVARNPYEWVLSAENHMRVGSGYSGGIGGNAGYFDRANIQSYMTGYGAAAQSTSSVCVGTIDHFLDIEYDLIPRVAGNLTLPLLNVRPHEVNITSELQEVVLKKYPLDLELWAVVKRQGLVCW